MSQPEGRNPERRSNNALLCFCMGAGFAIAAYVLGIGAIMGAVIAGNDPAMVVGGIFAALGIGLLFFSGLVLLFVGGIWMIIQVIADQRGEPSEKRYRDVER